MGRLNIAAHRRRLLEEQGHLGCHWCGLPFSGYQEATIEHLRPRFLGGSNAPENLALAHDRCNKWRGHLAYPEVPREPCGKDFAIAAALVRRHGTKVLRRTLGPYRDHIMELADAS